MKTIYFTVDRDDDETLPIDTKRITMYEIENNKPILVDELEVNIYAVSVEEIQNYLNDNGMDEYIGIEQL